ncbi:toxin [Candidatus Margulisiibacteriota bacterium]
MKKIKYSQEKNNRLKKERSISFEDVLVCLDNGNLLDDIKHPNKKEYSNQKMLVLLIKNYIYLVPYIENDEEVFLKTIIPSRKMTKIYLKGNKNA